MFTVVVMEINSRCNRRCTYCPNVVAQRDAPKVMKPAQFDSILDRLEKCHFNGRLSYHFYNEPLLPPPPTAIRRPRDGAATGGTSDPV